MVHIDPETLRRNPILGVLLGAAAGAMMGWLLYSGWPEMRLLLAQRSPDRVSLHEAVNQRQARWVTTSDGRWFCDRALTIERSMGPARWVMGRVEATEVPIAGDVVGELFVASFDGAVTCEARAALPLTGVIGSTKIFGSRSAHRRWERSADHVAILQVGASPRSALVMFLGRLRGLLPQVDASGSRAAFGDLARHDPDRAPLSEPGSSRAATDPDRAQGRYRPHESSVPQKPVDPRNKT